MESHFKRRRISRNGSPGAELHERRVRNDLRLKSAFESIFEKYGKDFSEIGDEIDFKTGEVVVNHGHVFGMKHETDPGCEKDLHDELDPEYWFSKDASKLSLESPDKPCASAVSYSLPEERPALDPAWRAPPLPKECLTVQKPRITLPSSPDYAEQKRSPSPAGVSVWALNPSVIHSKKPKQKKAAPPTHPKPPTILPKTKMREAVSATNVPNLTCISPQPEPEQNPAKSIPLTPSILSATSKATATSMWTTENDIHPEPNELPSRPHCKHHRRETNHGFISRDEADDPEPETYQHPQLLAKAQQEPAIVIQNKISNSRNFQTRQLQKKQNPRSSKLLNESTMTSFAGLDKDNKQIKPCTGHSNDVLEVILAENTKSKQQTHFKQTRTSQTLSDLDSAAITSSYAKPHEMAKPKALPTPKAIPQRAAAVQVKSRQNPVELLSQPILNVNPLPQTRIGSLKRTKVYKTTLSDFPNMGIELCSNSSVPTVSRNTPDTVNEELANGFWDPPVEHDSSREKKYATRMMCSKCSAQDTYKRFGKLCSACNQYKRRSQMDLPASMIEPRRYSNDHSDSHKLVQKSKNENKTKASQVPLPFIATPQAKVKDKLILPKQVLEMPKSPNSIMSSIRLLTLENVSEDELSTPVKIVGTKPNSTPKMIKPTQLNASNSRKRPQAEISAMSDIDELSL